MWRALPFLLLLAACSKGPQADLQYIGDARSLAAEWALINEQAQAGKLNATYVDSMRQWIRQQLETDLGALTQPDAPYAGEIRALSEVADDAPPAQLRAHAESLKQTEDSLESA